MAKKKHIPLFDDQLEMLELLTDQEVGQAVLAAMRFMRSGTETDLTGGAGVVYQVLRAQFIRNQNDAAVGKKGGRPRKSPAETPVSEAETTERNETEPDGTGQDGTEPDETESDRTGGGDGSAGGGLCFAEALAGGAPGLHRLLPGPGLDGGKGPHAGLEGRLPQCGVLGALEQAPGPDPGHQPRPHSQIRGLVMGRPQEWGGFRQPSVGAGFYPAQKHRAIRRNAACRARESPHFRHRCPDSGNRMGTTPLLCRYR